MNHHILPIIAQIMLHTLWLGAAIGVAAWISRFMLRGASPMSRYCVGLFWMVALASMPLVAAYLLVRAVPMDDAATAAVSASFSGGRFVSASTAGATLATTHFSDPFVPDGAPAHFTWQCSEIAMRWVSGSPFLAVALPLIWGIGAAMMLGWSMVGLAGGEWLRRNASSADPLWQRRLGLLTSRKIHLGLSGQIAAPVLIGIFKPLILLPPAILTELTPQQIEWILLHEIAHVRRWDNLVNLLQRLVESILFFHPAAWILSAWVRQEREHCCDQAVIERMSDRGRCDYAATLMSIYRSHWRLMRSASAATDGNLIARIRCIVNRRDSMRISRLSLLIVALPALLPVALLRAAAPTTALTTAESKTTLIVARQGGQYASVQAAIDAAPAGALIRIGEGVWRERLSVRKPLTIEGEKDGRTVLEMLIPPELYHDPNQPSPATRAHLWDGPGTVKKSPLDPVADIQNCRDVRIRNLKICCKPGPLHSPLGAVELVEIKDAAAVKVIDCEIVGSPSRGITISNSEVDVRHCLIAGMWETGIEVQAATAQPPKVKIDGCDIRNCYYAGIVIQAGTDVMVEECRISGTAWHGIRYDNTSPRISHNRIFEVARSGIYASGATHAIIENNLFADCEMDGISCWFANQDEITANTFVDNKREGLMALGNSRPSVHRNIFVRHPVAIDMSKISGDRSDAAGRADLDSNVFWQNQVNAQHLVSDKMEAFDLPPSTHSRVESVQFVDADHGNYALAQDSPLRAAKIGEAEPLPAASPYPIQPQESQIMPKGDSYDYRKWNTGG